MSGSETIRWLVIPYGHLSELYLSEAEARARVDELTADSPVSEIELVRLTNIWVYRPNCPAEEI